MAKAKLNRYNVHFKRLSSTGSWQPAKRTYQATTDNGAMNKWKDDYDPKNVQFVELTRTLRIAQIITEVKDIRL